MAHQSKRHVGNSNLHLHYEDTFRGLPVMMPHAPFITEYLERLYETTQLALSDHRQVFAVRFDLRFPDDYLSLVYGNTVISRFVDSLTFRIQSARQRSALIIREVTFSFLSPRYVTRIRFLSLRAFST